MRYSIFITRDKTRNRFLETTIQDLNRNNICHSFLYTFVLDQKLQVIGNA